MSVVFAILLFSLLIFVHELGHFVAAKLSPIRISITNAVSALPAFFAPLSVLLIIYSPNNYSFLRTAPCAPEVTSEAYLLR